MTRKSVVDYQGGICMGYKIDLNYSFITNYLNTQSSNKSTASSGANFLGDYYAIKNGSYYKLAKKFYSSEAAGKTGSTTAVSEQKNTKVAQSSANSAANDINELMKDSLYEKIEKKDSDGNITKDYNRTAIMDKLNKFVNDYNSVVENTGELSDTTVLNNAVNMVNQTKVYSSSLNRVGIEIENDNKLSIDEKKFNEADLSELKNLFGKGTSFGSNVRLKMLQIENAAKSALNSQGSLYSSQAITNASTGSMFDSLF